MDSGSEGVKRLVIAVSSGAGTGTIVPQWSLARWVRVHPIAETDTFDVTFKDGESSVMLVRTSMTGTMSEQLNLSLGILKTIVIANAAQDGNYVVHFDLH